MNEKLFTGDFVKISNFNQENFVGEGSSPLSCRKYLWTVNPVFRKIYAHKWLCIAVCGHNIFLVTISWSEWGESNSRPRHPKCRALPTGLHPDFIKFFSKWSNMWSNGFPTEISAKQKHRGGVVWKGICGKRLCEALWRFCAPKCRALPTGLHPDFYEFFSKWSNLWSNGFPTEISAKQKHRDDVVWKGMCNKPLCKALRRFYAPKWSAIPIPPRPMFTKILYNKNRDLSSTER